MTSEKLITTADKLGCLERELEMRYRVYARRVENGKMTQQKADREIALMEEIAADYTALAGREGAPAMTDRDDVPPKFRLGNEPIEQEYDALLMNGLGNALDEALNGDKTGGAREVGFGFCLMVFPFANFDGRASYVSNARRADIIRLLEEQLAHVKGQKA